MFIECFYTADRLNMLKRLAANLAHTWEDLIPKSVAMLGHDLPLPS